MILTNVKKKLGNFILDVEKLDLSKPGIYGLIGHNGCGKSTLAKIIAGFIEKDSGTIETNGLSIKDITFLGRKPYMMEDTVYNNLLYPLKIRKMEAEKVKVNEYLDKMKFSGREKQRAKSLSGGEQQKLAFLRAIIFKPKLIIADEAMTAMDMDSLDLFERTIKEEQKKENSVWLIISHQMAHIKRICDNIIFMYCGKIEEEGKIAQVLSCNNANLNSYLHTYDSALSLEIPDNKSGVK